MPNTDVHVVLVTAPDREAAAELVRRLLDERLVACGNILGGLTSVYRWEGETQEDSEALIILKTHSSTLQDVVKRTAQLHPYDVPEILALPVAEGLASYLTWVGRECTVPTPAQGGHDEETA